MKETFYFSHDYNSRNDEKILKLIQKEGWEGYGIYWALIEKLYEANGFLAEDYECIAFDLRADCDRIKRIINDYKLFIIASKKIHSKSCLARLAVRKGISEQNRQNAILRWNKRNLNNATALRPQSEGNASKGKESKGKKILLSNDNDIEFPLSKKDYSYLLGSHQRHIQIVGLFARWISAQIENKGQLKMFIGRHSKDAKQLSETEITNEKLEEEFMLADKESNNGLKYRWTLSTIIKNLTK